MRIKDSGVPSNYRTGPPPCSRFFALQSTMRRKLQLAWGWCLSWVRHLWFGDSRDVGSMQVRSCWERKMHQVSAPDSCIFSERVSRHGGVKKESLTLRAGLVLPSHEFSSSKKPSSMQEQESTRRVKILVAVRSQRQLKDNVLSTDKVPPTWDQL